MLQNLDLNYCATIVKVENLQKLEKLDNLLGFPIFNCQALVSKDTQEGDIGVLFVAGTQLSGDFVHKNNLYRKPEFNSDVSKTGYIEEKRRVKAIKLRGNYSTALFMPLSSLDYLGYDFKVGDAFTHVNGHEVCKKYLIQEQKKSVPGQKKQRKIKKTTVEPKLFPEHIDTSHYARNKHLFKDSDFVIVTCKLHGCLHKDTVIQTNIGEKTISEIVDNKLKVKVKSFNILSNKIVFSEILDYFVTDDIVDWFEIETENGEKIKVTGDHLIFLPKLKCYRKVKDLTENDVVLLS